MQTSLAVTASPNRDFFESVPLFSTNHSLRFAPGLPGCMAFCCREAAYFRFYRVQLTGKRSSNNVCRIPFGPAMIESTYFLNGLYRK